MQEKVYDNRTFGQIWEQSSATQRQEMQYRILREGLCATSMSINNWKNGKYRPKVPAQRIGVARIISNVLGITTTADILFPEK